MNHEQNQTTRGTPVPCFSARSSFIIPRSSLFCALLIVATAFPVYSQPVTTPSLRVPSEPDRIERLRSHGLSPAPTILAHFLEHGFAPGTNLADLPTTPALKTQIVIDAIVESARQQVIPTAPTLGRLALGLLSPGIRTILDWDIQQQRSGERATFETDTIKRLRLNAIVALGLIGDLDRTYELLAVFGREKDPAIKIPCALALATLGSRAGLSYLVDEVRRANRTTSVSAAQALKFIAGWDYGPTADDPILRRQAAAKDWKNWWKRDGKTFRPDRNQILARRLTPPIRPNPRDPRTVRELMDCIAYPEDPRWTIDAYDAHERLRLMGVAALDGLEQIITNKSENLVIRRQAIMIYSQMATVAYARRTLPTHQPKRAYKTLWWLQWDRNPEIREAVRQCLPRLRKAK